MSADFTEKSNCVRFYLRMFRHAGLQCSFKF